MRASSFLWQRGRVFVRKIYNCSLLYNNTHPSLSSLYLTFPPLPRPCPSLAHPPAPFSQIQLMSLGSAVSCPSWRRWSPTTKRFLCIPRQKVRFYHSTFFKAFRQTEVESEILAIRLSKTYGNCKLALCSAFRAANSVLRVKFIMLFTKYWGI